MRAGPACFLLLLLAAAAPAPPVPVYRAFGRWFVACDNTRSCEARGFGEEHRTDLRVLRAAGPGPVTLALTSDETALVPGDIHLDGAPFPLMPPGWAVEAAGPDHAARLSTVDPAAILGFVAAARSGHALQLGAPGPETDSVPLDGFTAALLLMDAVQGRPGTASALVAEVGTGEAPAAPPVPRLPAWVAPPPLTRAETRVLLARTPPPPKDGPCTHSQAPEVYALDAHEAIVIRGCNMFAYQGSGLVYRLPRRGGGVATPVVLATPGLPRAESDPVGPEMTGPSFDPATGTLSMSAKGRGLADCGFAAEWVWHARAFHLVSMVFEDQCGGSAAGDWATLFRTTGRP